jgi:hypothetical protein
MVRIIEPISKERIAGSAERQMFLALKEGASVIAVGSIPGQGYTAVAMGVYRGNDEGTGYQGWMFVNGHPNPKCNGFFFHENTEL